MSRVSRSEELGCVEEDGFTDFTESFQQVIYGKWRGRQRLGRGDTAIPLAPRSNISRRRHRRIPHRESPRAVWPCCVTTKKLAALLAFSSLGRGIGESGRVKMRCNDVRSLPEIDVVGAFSLLCPLAVQQCWRRSTPRRGQLLVQ